MVVFDSSLLLPILYPGIPTPNGSDGKPISRYVDRVEYLVERLTKKRTKILVPTPALAEVLVQAGSAGHDYLDRISNASAFRVVSFCQRAAVEVASMANDAKKSKKKRVSSSQTGAKVKYDRQIIAVAKVHAVSTLYSDDSDLAKLGAKFGVMVTGAEALPLPPKEDPKLPFGDEDES